MQNDIKQKAEVLLDFVKGLSGNVGLLESIKKVDPSLYCEATSHPRGGDL